MALSNDVVYLVNDGIDNKRLKHGTLKTDLETVFVPLAGGTMLGPLNVVDPTTDYTAAHKKYVDNEIVNIQNQLDDAIEAISDGTFRYQTGSGSAPGNSEVYFANGSDYTPNIADVKEIFISKVNIEGQIVTFADVEDGTYI